MAHLTSLNSLQGRSNTNGAMDTTGRRHIFKIKSDKYPPIRRTQKIRTNLELCKRCDQNDQYVETLEAHIDELDRAVENLTHLLNCLINISPDLESKKNSFILNDSNQFSNLNIEELLKFSDKITEETKLK
ncbi:hypothetical protein G9A89_011536 [Geosiphon pyriformis]|nr:hypothetical protein G9A89_011536 [Geosiphon pyriformis]